MPYDEFSRKMGIGRKEYEIENECCRLNASKRCERQIERLTKDVNWQKGMRNKD